MVPLAEIVDYAVLIEQRRALFVKLIECSETQISLLSSDREEENLFSLFSSSVQEWNQCTQQIDGVQSLLNSLPSDHLDDAEELVELVELLATNVEKAKHLLEQSVDHTGTDLMHTRAQRKLMNAYYGIENTDQIPLYFDQKK